MPDRVLVELTIAAPADAVWEAMRDPAQINNWFGWDAPSLQEEIEYIFVTHAKRDEDRKVLFFEGVPDRFEVVDQGGRTLLRVVRTVAETDSWDGVYEDMTEGWISFVQQLKLAMEHDLAPRRTLYLEGAAKPGGQAPIAALGLTDHAATPAGQPVRVTLPTGEVIDGQAWHRTPWQFGFTVPQWGDGRGDGMLIVTDKSKKDTSPDGRGMVVLTTYGLSEAAFADLEATWTAWWNARFAKAQEAGCT
jgi:hypothetical protein